jgi:methyl-accepting chemotaxis protein
MQFEDDLAQPIRPGGQPRLKLEPDGRVLVAVGALLILVVAGIGIAVWLIMDLRSASADLTEREVEYAAAIGDIALISKTLANDERGYLMSGSNEFVRQWEGRTAQVHEAFSRAYASATQEQWQTVDRAQRSFDAWHVATTATMADFAAGSRDAAIEASLEENRLLRKEYEARLNGMQSLASFAVESASAEVSSTLARAVAILIGCLVVAVVIGGLIGLWLLQRLVRPINELLHGLTEDVGRVPAGPPEPARSRTRRD